MQEEKMKERAKKHAKILLFIVYFMFASLVAVTVVDLDSLHDALILVVGMILGMLLMTVIEVTEKPE